MLKVFVVDGQDVPTLCCDWCKLRIDDPRMAGYFDDVTPEGEPIGDVYLFHKGCATRFERKRGGRFVHWDEMTYMLEDLPRCGKPYQPETGR